MTAWRIRTIAMQWLNIILSMSILTSICFGEVVIDKDRFINAFVDHLTKSDQQSSYEEPVLGRIEKKANNEYYLEIKVKATHRNNRTAHEYLYCYGIVKDYGDTAAARDTECANFVDVWTDNKDTKGDGTGYTLSDGSNNFLQIEVQPTNTTGPLLLDPNAASVINLATHGVWQLDRHEPNTRHSLKNVLFVERHNQLGGIKSIITFNVDYDNCTETGREDCTFQKTCKIIVVQMPQQKLLLEGTKFRAVSNNCTEEWISDRNTPNSVGINIPEKYSIINDHSGNTLPKTSGNNTSDTVKNIRTVKENKLQAKLSMKMSLKSRTSKKYQNSHKYFKLDKELPSKYVTSSGTQQRQRLQLSKVKEERESINQNSVDPSYYLRLAEESLAQYSTLADSKNYYKPIEIVKVTAQPRSGVLMEIEFKASATHCMVNNSGEPTSSVCEVLSCLSAVLKEPLGKNITVNCSPVKSRLRRQLGGQKRQDPNDPKYMKLVEESLIKYVTSSGISQHYKPIGIQSVFTQVVSGMLTFITFVASATNCTVDSEGRPTFSTCEIKNPQNRLFCNTKIWEQSWLNHKDINIICSSSAPKVTFRRNSLYDVKVQDPSDPKYLRLAEESLAEYSTSSDNRYYYKPIKIVKVTSQLTAGALTNIIFKASATNCKVNIYGQPTSSGCEVQNTGEVLNCFAAILKLPWLSRKDVVVNCHPEKSRVRKLRVGDPNEVYGGEEVAQDLNDFRYWDLAEESLEKYMTSTGTRQHYKLVEIRKVTTKVVAGIQTNIKFTASATNCTLDGTIQPTTSICKVKNPQNLITCHSEIWSQWWLNKEDIHIECFPIASEVKQVNRQRLGGDMIQNPRDPKYFRLAEESLVKYVTTTGIRQHYKPTEIIKVTSQVVSGVVTTVYFKASETNCAVDMIGRPNSFICEVRNPQNEMFCQSKIWEQAWLNKKDIDIKCVPALTTNEISNIQSLPGGQGNQNPNDPKYFRLAEESLAKYVTSTGIRQHYKPTEIMKVTTQVVSGMVTRIDFTASATNCAVDSNGRPTFYICEVQNPQTSLICLSEIWEQAWLNKKDIDIKCDPALTTNQNSNIQSLPGGQVNQNPNDPKYFRLAEESLVKYVSTTGIRQHYKPTEIMKVTTQVVSGMVTKIDFTASATNCAVDSNGRPSFYICEVQNPQTALICLSEIWEQAWLNKKDIYITCVPTDNLKL